MGKEQRPDELRPTFFEGLIGAAFTAVRQRDAAAYIGSLEWVQSPILRVRFPGATDLKDGDEMMCRVADGRDSVRINATIVATDSEVTSLWMTVHAAFPEVSREPRANVGPVHARVSLGQLQFQSHLLDVSMSGLRISSDFRVEAGTAVTVEVSVGMIPISLPCIVARVNQAVSSNLIEMGLSIQRPDRLMTARWKVFVEDALKYPYPRPSRKTQAA